MMAEEVVAGALQGRFAFLDGREVDGLDGVDAERLDDGAVRQGILSIDILILAAAGGV